MKATIVKVFPIEGRTDFFKYVIKVDGVIQKDYGGKEMYFDPFALKQCVTTCEAINKVRGYDTSFPVIDIHVDMDSTEFYRWLEVQEYELPTFIEAIKLYTGKNEPFIGRGDDGKHHKYVFEYFWRKKLKQG